MGTVNLIVLLLFFAFCFFVGRHAFIKLRRPQVLFFSFETRFSINIYCFRICLFIFDVFFLTRKTKEERSCQRPRRQRRRRRRHGRTVAVKRVRSQISIVIGLSSDLRRFFMWGTGLHMVAKRVLSQTSIAIGLSSDLRRPFYVGHRAT